VEQEVQKAMKSSVVWLFALTGLYWSYCLFWGVKGFYRAKTASDYFIAGRTIPMWVFVLAATATSFSGWTFVGHPALVWRDGLQYAFASFYVITIPFTGTVFLKRIWMVGKRYGYITPGEMYGDYLGSEAIRILTVLVAMIFSVPYLGLQLRASGVLFNVLSNGLVPTTVGMWALAIVVVLYVALGGLRSVAYVDTVQCILLMAGICVIGLITIVSIGGWGEFTRLFHGMISEDLARNANLYGQPVATPDGYHRLVAIPGPIQFVSNLGASRPQGGIWTGSMILTYMFALMGIQAAPAFTMWGFSNTNPKPFAPQQVWASALGVGVCLFLFTTTQGLGGWVLIKQGLFSAAQLGGGNQEALVPDLINLLQDSAPFLVGVLAVCALAAMQSTGSAYLSTASGMLTRDIYLRYVNKGAPAARQKLFGRLGVVVVCLLALLVATFSTDALVMLGGLAVSFGTQMWIPLLATLYVPWFTRQGVVAGLSCGLLAVLLTYPFNVDFMISLHNALGFGHYPLTIHCAGWGIAVNALVAVLVSAVTQPDRAESNRRFGFHRFLRLNASVPPHKAHLKKLGWAIVVLWFLFAIGPLAHLGNNFFFFDAGDPSTWPGGMPPLWLWQLVWWLLGVYMMYFLAYKLEFSTHFGTVHALRDDIATTYSEQSELHLDVEKP